jgi:predicted phosphodiesterase
LLNNNTKDHALTLFMQGNTVREVKKIIPSFSTTTLYRIRKKAVELLEKLRPETSPVVGIIGDTHIPFEHPNYLQFCKDTFEQYSVHKVVHIGDLVDNHAMSYHESDPDGLSAGDEFSLAIERLQEWYESFPVVDWMLGNHDNIPLRRVKSAGLSKHVLRENIYGMPTGWKQHESLIMNGVHYSHGIGRAGVNGARNNAVANGMSSVMGHLHSFAGVQYIATPLKITFGMSVGCGVDVDSYAAEYGKYFANRPTLGCGIVLNEKTAIFVPMDFSKYSRRMK